MEIYTLLQITSLVSNAGFIICMSSFASYYSLNMAIKKLLFEKYTDYANDVINFLTTCYDKVVFQPDCVVQIILTI